MIQNGFPFKVSPMAMDKPPSNSCAVCPGLLLLCELQLIEHPGAQDWGASIAAAKDVWDCLKIGYIPNEIAIFHRDNDQQNHWV